MIIISYYLLLHIISYFTYYIILVLISTISSVFIYHLNKALDSSTVMAKGFLKDGNLLPAGKKNAEAVLAYRKSTAFSVTSFDAALDKIETCFLATSKRVTTKGDFDV